MRQFDVEFLSPIFSGVRILCCLYLAPVFSDKNFPSSIKSLIFISLIFILSFSLNPDYDGSWSLSCLGPEIVIGIFLGLLVRLCFSVLQVAGTMIAQSMSISQLFGTNNSEHMPAISLLLTLGGAALLLVNGYISIFLKFLAKSFEIYPLCGGFEMGVVYDWTLESFSDLFGFAFVLATPFLVVSLVYNIMIGAINRAMPQMMVALIGAPLITFLGIATLMLTLPEVLSIWMAKVMLILEV